MVRHNHIDDCSTVLSQAHGNCTILAFGTQLFWKGFQVGCCTCDNDPDSKSATADPPTTVGNVPASTVVVTQATVLSAGTAG